MLSCMLLRAVAVAVAVAVAIAVAVVAVVVVVVHAHLLQCVQLFLLHACAHDDKRDADC